MTFKQFRQRYLFVLSLVAITACSPVEPYRAIADELTIREVDGRQEVIRVWVPTGELATYAITIDERVAQRRALQACLSSLGKESPVPDRSSASGQIMQCMADKDWALVAAPSTGKDPLPPHDTIDIQSSVLGETRRINVWTPPGYGDHAAIYPVLYMPDGGIHEDFPHIANTIAELVENGSIAPLLVIGIENTVRRRDLTGSSGVKTDADVAPISDGARRFRDFIATELFAEIESRYRVSQERAIIGESLAGLFVVETLLLKPELFSRYIAFDPSLWWNNHALVDRAEECLRNMSDSKRSLWFASSDAIDIVANAKLLVSQLEKHAPQTLDWSHQPYADEKHWTIFRAGKERAFKSTLWNNP